MYYSIHTRNLISIFEFFLCHEEPVVKGVCHLPVKVGCQSTLTLLLRRVSPRGLRISMRVWQSLHMNVYFKIECNIIKKIYFKSIQLIYINI